MLYQLPSTYRAEDTIASRLAILKAVPSVLPPIIIDKAILWAQERAGFDFDPCQAEAIAKALQSKLSVITGGPGTGKTTILRALVDILKAKKVHFLLAAPTGRAAQRMSEATRAYAQTIHRLLKFDVSKGGFTANEEQPLKTDYVIIDESSMLDTKLAASLLKAIPAHAHLLLVGDVFQLPSIGPGNILKDAIQSNQFAVSFLKTIFRQHAVSKIVTTAHAILEGICGAPGVIEHMNEINARQDLHFIKAVTPEACTGQIVDLVKNHIPHNFPKYNSFMSVQVLAPMHRGTAGIGSLNHLLQQALNPDKPGFFVGSTRFQLGDKVIQTRNNYDKNIFNGDLGLITHINAESGTVMVDFDGQLVELERVDLGDLSLAYAMSIHKSQGSEFPVVVIPLLKQHFLMLQRNLIYTAITRGRRKVFIVGDPVAYAMAVNNHDTIQRKTHLCEKIQKAIGR